MRKKTRKTSRGMAKSGLIRKDKELPKLNGFSSRIKLLETNVNLALSLQVPKDTEFVI